MASIEPVPVEELAALNPHLDERGLARLQAFEQLLAEDDEACGLDDSCEGQDESDLDREPEGWTGSCGDAQCLRVPHVH